MEAPSKVGPLGYKEELLDFFNRRPDAYPHNFSSRAELQADIREYFRLETKIFWEKVVRCREIHDYDDYFKRTIAKARIEDGEIF